MSDNSGNPVAALPRLNSEQRMWRWKILISTYIGYGGYYLTRKVFTICKTTIADDFDVELGDMAWIWGSFLLAYMIGQFVNSFLGRKWGPRVILLGGLGISMAINVVFGFTNSLPTFVVFMFFNGLVQATGWCGVVGAISLWLRPTERGKIMGFWSTSYLMGNLVVKSLGAFLLGHWGWQWSFWGCTMLTVGVWLLLYFWQRNTPEDAGLDPIIEEEEEDTRTIRVSNEEDITFREYLKLATHPVVIAMGTSYFCIKFLRYALDSWLPAFLDVQGMTAEQAGYYSSIFDLAGLAGAILAGFALDRVFRGNWAALCFTMGLGIVVGYFVVLQCGANPYALAISFGLVGFMMYGPDTILCGAASVTAAGERNGVAMAGLVNGFGSIGPVVQEGIIGYLIRGDEAAGIRNTNLLCLGMSILFVLLMLIVMWRVRAAHKHHDSMAA